jgi:hypothetical protein
MLVHHAMPAARAAAGWPGGRPCPQLQFSASAT